MLPETADSFFQSHLQCCSSLGFSTFTWHSLGPGLVVSLPVLQTLLLSVLVEEQEDWLQLVFFQWHHQIRFGGPFALHQAGNGGISHWHLYHLWGTLHLFLGFPFWRSSSTMLSWLAWAAWVQMLFLLVITSWKLGWLEKEADDHLGCDFPVHDCMWGRWLQVQRHMFAMPYVAKHACPPMVAHAILCSKIAQAILLEMPCGML